MPGPGYGKQTRQCDNPAPDGGEDCSGSSVHECTLREWSCGIEALVAKAQAITHGSVDRSCPGGDKKDDENVFGGESCPFECTPPYKRIGSLVCRNGKWEGPAKCGKF